MPGTVFDSRLMSRARSSSIGQGQELAVMPSLKQQVLNRETSPGKKAKEAGCRCSTCTFRARGNEGGSGGRSRGKGAGASCKLVAFDMGLDKRATVESRKKQVDPEGVQRNRSRNRSSSRSMEFMPSLRKKVLDRDQSLGREELTTESKPDTRPTTPSLRKGSTTSPDSRKCSKCCDKKEEEQEEEEDEEEESCKDCAPHASTMKTVAGQEDKATEIEVQACGCLTALTFAGLEVSLLLRHV